MDQKLDLLNTLIFFLMEKSNLINILRALTKKELRELSKWVHSPAHNLREDVVNLYEYISNEVHLYNSKFLSKEEAFPNVYPEENFDDAKMRQSMYFLLKCIEEYLAFKELTDDDARYRITISRVYRKRKLDKVFLKSVKQSQNLQDKKGYKNERYYRNKYLLQQERYRYLSEQKRLTELNLQEVSDALDLTFLADKLRQACIMLSHQTVYKVEYNFGMTDSVLKYVEGNGFFECSCHCNLLLYIYDHN